MSVSFTFYIGFKKRSNSTQRPPSNLFSIDLDCVFKDNTNMANPTLRVAATMSDDMSKYRYAVGNSRYYNVVNWRWTGGIWEVDLKCDFLATYKTDIGSYSGLIRRAGAAYNDRIIDDLTIGLESVSALKAKTDTTYLAGVTYLIGIYGNTGVDYYTFNSQTSFDTVISKLFGDISDIFPEADYNTFDVHRYIACINRLPYTITGTETVNFIPIGPWKLDLTAAKLSDNQVYTHTITVTLYEHPQASDSATYLNSSPYTQTICRLPGFGIFSLDVPCFEDSSSINFSVTADPRTCSAYLIIDNSSGGLYEKIQGTLGGEISATKSQVSNSLLAALPTRALQYMNELGDYEQVIEDWGKSTYPTYIPSAIPGDPPIEMNIPFIDTIVANTVKSAIRVGYSKLYNALSVTTVGSNQSLALLDDIVIYQIFQKVVFPNYSELGYPYYTISTPLNGFNQFAAPAIKLDGFAGEETIVNTYLRGGFYYE